MKRRHVLAALAAGSGVLAIGWGVMPPRQRLNPSKPLTAIDKTSALNGWVRIGEDDSVTVVMSKSEMGQGVFTGLGMLLAEELDARWDQVRFEQSPNDNIYNNLAGVADGLPFHPDNQGMVKSSAQWLVRKAMREMGLMFTGGSTSIKDLWLPMREAGASARAMLVGAAAQQWQVPTSECDVKDGVVSHSSGKKATFGELSAAAAKVSLPPSITLKSAVDFKLIGQSLPRLDTETKSDGSALFVGDIRPDGLLFACVRMNPMLGGKLQSFDDSKALAMPGVKKVLAIDALHGTSAGVAVVAASTYQAMKALTQVEVKWDNAPSSAWSSDTIDAELRKALDSDTGFAYFSNGDAANALQKAARTVKAEYHAPYLAHAPMEPMGCTVWFKDGAAQVWASTQVPDLACKVVAKQLGIEVTKVQLHIPMLGSGFGRRLEMDIIAQAAVIAKAMEGTPVQTLWSRSEDMQHDFYRPVCISRFHAGLDAQGQLVAWQNTSASQAIVPQVMARSFGLPGAGPDKTTAEGAFDQAYEWPNARIAHVAVDLPIPVGFWRSVGHSHQAFFKESFVDEMAFAAGQNPLDFRLGLLKNHPRHAKVLQTAADKSGWRQAPAVGADGAQRALGIALHESFGSIVAQVAEVSIQNKQIVVHRVVCAIDCGTAVNPMLIAQQMESSVVFGLSAALFGEITIDKGRVQQSNFNNYPVLRLPQAPEVDTHIIESDAHPEGVGEPGTPPVAPAVANAVFALTGQRLRQLPLRLPT